MLVFACRCLFANSTSAFLSVPPRSAPCLRPSFDLLLSVSSDVPQFILVLHGLARLCSSVSIVFFPLPPVYAAIIFSFLITPYFIVSNNYVFGCFHS